MDLEKNGLVKDLYFLLWKKTDYLKDEFKINIPQTIIIKQNQPFAWYFTDREGFLKKKLQKNLNLTTIYEIFSKNYDGIDVVAYFINEIKSEDDLFLNFNKIYRKHRSFIDGKLCIEYFNKEELYFFLFSDDRKKTGILQKFIPSYEENNTMIETIWSPNVCIFSKRMNLKKLTETKLDKYERCSLFEGPEHLSTTKIINENQTTTNLRKIANNIVYKVKNVSNTLFTINRIILFFKKDKKGNLWFLFSSSLRLEKISIKKFSDKENYMPLEIENNFIRPDFVNKDFSINIKKPKQLICDIECPGCSQKSQKNQFFFIRYKHLVFYIDSFENTINMNSNIKFDKQIEQKTLTKNNIKIEEYPKNFPYIFQKLHPNLNYNEYQKIKKTSIFLNKEIPFCEECYLTITKILHNSETSSIHITKQNLLNELLFGNLENFKSWVLKKKINILLIKKVKMLNFNPKQNNKKKINFSICEQNIEKKIFLKNSYPIKRKYSSNNSTRPSSSYLSQIRKDSLQTKIYSSRPNSSIRQISIINQDDIGCKGVSKTQLDKLQEEKNTLDQNRLFKIDKRNSCCKSLYDELIQELNYY